MARLLQPIRRFQGKLTLSYTLVTVTATAIVQIIFLLVISIADRAALSVDGLRAAVEGEAIDLAGGVVAALQRSPPAQEPVMEWIDATFQSLPSRLARRLRSRSPLRYPPEIESSRLVVTDRSGGVLAAMSSEDEILGADSVPALLVAGKASLSQVLAGAPSSARCQEDGRCLAAVPITEATGEKLGVLVAEVWIERPDLMTQLTRIIGALPVTLSVLLPLVLLVGVCFGFLGSRGLTRRLEQLGTAADAWSRGDFTRRVRDASADELGELTRRLDGMADQLATLLQTRRELAALEERNRLARELHDNVKQLIFSTTFLLGSAEALAPSDATAARARVIEARELAQKAGRELSALIRELRPAALDGKGLAAALEKYTTTWSGRTGTVCRLAVRNLRPLPLEVEQAFFRVAQEALSNVARHSGARHVDVELAVGRPGSPGADDRLSLSIRDDGEGFDGHAETSGGFGLHSMKERLEGLGGDLRVLSDTSGTLVEACCEVTPSLRDEASEQRESSP